MESQSVRLPKPMRFAAAPNIAPHHRRHGFKQFLRHAAEMTAAMVLGMTLGGLLGTSDAGSPELRALLMAASMTVPMVIWMRFRRHSWQSSAEMAAAMVLPVVALFAPLWLGVISSDTMIALQHGLMLPSMLAAMLYRRMEYGR